MSDDPLIGAVLGDYLVTDRVGGGAMGVVYRAEDVRLGRAVALKLLHERGEDQGLSRAALMDEAKVVSLIDHPNVCTLYSVGEAPDGRFFLAMAYYDGETLASILARGALAHGEAVDYAVQAARGLQAAHSRGIVHCDIKPGNLFVTSTGVVKILDFGIAHSNDPGATRTEAESVVGTLAYVAPERFKGGAMDARADLWALGVVLYEMLAGRRPFEAESPQALMHAIIAHTPKPLLSTRTGVPRKLEAIVARALRKQSEARYQNAEALIQDLEPLLTPPNGRTELKGQEKGNEPSAAVAVLALRSIGEGHAFLAEAITEEITTACQVLKGVRVIPRTSASRYAGRNETAQQVGRELGASLIVEGSVTSVGTRARVLARVVDVEAGHVVCAKTYDTDDYDLLKLQDEVGSLVVQAISAYLEKAASPAAVVPITSSVEAQQHYLLGRQLAERQTPATIRRAIEVLGEAVKADPAFPLSYAGLADCYALEALLGTRQPLDAFRDAESVAGVGSTLAVDAAEVQYSAAVIRHWFYWDWLGAEEAYRRSLSAGDGSTASHGGLATVLASLGRRDEAATHASRAAALGQDSPWSLTQAAGAWLLIGDDASAQRWCERAVKAEPSSILTRCLLAMVAMRGDRHDEAIAIALEGLQVAGRHPALISIWGAAHGMLGRREAAVALDELRQLSQSQYVPALCFADIYASMGETELCLEWLELALEERSTQLIWVNANASYRGLAHDARIAELLGRLDGSGK